jgi:hypothetical protein
LKRQQKRPEHVVIPEDQAAEKRGAGVQGQGFQPPPKESEEQPEIAQGDGDKGKDIALAGKVRLLGPDHGKVKAK